LIWVPCHKSIPGDKTGDDAAKAVKVYLSKVHISSPPNLKSDFTHVTSFLVDELNSGKAKNQHTNQLN